MMPPMGTPEATVMAEVLTHLYNPQHPYHLVFGGQAVGAAVTDALPDAPHLDIRAFDQMERFSVWLGTLDRS